MISRNGNLMSRFAGLGEQIAASLDDVGDAIAAYRSAILVSSSRIFAVGAAVAIPRNSSTSSRNSACVVISRLIAGPSTFPWPVRRWHLAPSL